MSLFFRCVSSSLCLVIAFAAVGSAPLAAQEQSNVVQINIVDNAIKITNRGVGLCKTAAADCPDEVVWRWVGSSPNPAERPKIVISFIKGTSGAENCFKGATNQPRIFFEIFKPQTQAVAQVDSACPAKSAWLYQISCVRTDEEHQGELCTGIEPVDPGVVIG